MPPKVETYQVTVSCSSDEPENMNYYDIEDEYVNERIKGQIKWYSGKSAQNKRTYIWLQFFEFVAAALIPVCVAFLEGHWFLRLIVALLGAGLAIMEGVEKLCKSHENWLDYRTVAERLKCELYYYKTQSGPYKNVDDRFNHLVEQVERILSTEHAVWRERSTEASTPKPH